jgi:hypothetical protein
MSSGKALEPSPRRGWEGSVTHRPTAASTDARIRATFLRPPKRASRRRVDPMSSGKDRSGRRRRLVIGNGLMLWIRAMDPMPSGGTGLRRSLASRNAPHRDLRLMNHFMDEHSSCIVHIQDMDGLQALSSREVAASHVGRARTRSWRARALSVAAPAAVLSKMHHAGRSSPAWASRCANRSSRSGGYSE